MISEPNQERDRVHQGVDWTDAKRRNNVRSEASMKTGQNQSLFSSSGMGCGSTDLYPHRMLSAATILDSPDVSCHRRGY